MPVMEGRPSHEVFVRGPRVALDRQAFLQAFAARAMLRVATDGVSRDRFRKQRRAAVDAAQDLAGVSPSSGGRSGQEPLWEEAGEISGDPAQGRVCP